MSSFFDKKIEFLRGVGAQRAAVVNKEINIFTFGDLLEYYPFRHEDRTQFHLISQITADMDAAHVKGRIRSIEKIGEKFKQRLVAQFTDGTGDIELVWFQGVAWMEKRLKENADYVIYGKPALFNGRYSISHPEIDPLTQENSQRGYFQPVYPLTEKLRRRYIDGKMIGGWMKTLIEQALPHIRETLPASLIKKYRLISKQEALYHIHLPLNFDALHQANRRLKFEELFYNQLRLVMNKLTRREDYPGQVFGNTELVTDFYENHLPFELTNAQVRVVKEIVRDFRSGRQMKLGTRRIHAYGGNLPTGSFDYI
ncbi:MAG: OB-fold nucleic acid binding domain-containing protein [Spirosomataceae bacterium]